MNYCPCISIKRFFSISSILLHHNYLFLTYNIVFSKSNSDRYCQQSFYVRKFVVMQESNIIYLEKLQSCTITENGLCHLTFDFLSLLENCALSIIGALFIEEVEDFFNWPELIRFCTVVISTHIFGLILKLFYYQYQHPWTQLSKAYKCMGNVSKAVIGVIVIVIMIAMPLIGYLLSQNSAKFTTASIVLFVLTGLSTLLVSLHFFSKRNNWSYNYSD